MKILSLYMSGFKNHKDPITFHFKNINHIFGENYSGKTTISDAILYAIYGVDRYGNKAYVSDFINTDSQSCTVEVTIEINKKLVKITRTNHSNKMSLLINDKESSQSSLNRMIGDANLFRYIFIVDSITNEEKKDSREFIIDLLKKSGYIQNSNSIEELEKQLKNIRSENKRLEKENIFLKGQKEQIQNQMYSIKLNVDACKEKVDHSEKTEYQLQLQELEQKLENLLIQIGHHEENKKQLLLDSKSLEEKLNKVQTTFISGSRCPTCNQIIFEKQIQVIEEMTIKEKELIENQLKLISRKITVLSNTLNCLFQEKENTTKLIQHMKVKLEEFRSHDEVLHQMKLKQKLASDLATIDSQIQHIEIETRKFKSIARGIQQQIAELAKLYQNEVNQYLDLAEVKLFKTLSNGELRPDYTVYYKKRPFRMLSYSERIRCMLELVQAFQKIAKSSFPIFIDNMESITELSPPNTQVFTASVRKGCSLTVISKD